MSAIPMSAERQRRLSLGDSGRGMDLTLEELHAGYHWCPEWDDLVISPYEPEWGDNPKVCCCGYPLLRPSYDDAMQTGDL